MKFLKCLVAPLLVRAAAAAAVPMVANNMLHLDDSASADAHAAAIAAAEAEYPARTLMTPVDHFHNDSRYEPHSKDMFPMRYYFDAKSYKPGGPVFVLLGGEISVTTRLPLLQKGIVQQLAQATGGIAVALEHRYYGTSFPAGDTSVKAYRFLSTEQSLADIAYFAQHVKFAGLEQMNLTSPRTPYIVYGGSYAGGQAAFMRTLYPGVYFGAISSSGVTKAITDYWQYYDAIIRHGPKSCIQTMQAFVNVTDEVLFKHSDAVAEYKALFNMGGQSSDEAFASRITSGIKGWQSRNWDPAISSKSFDSFCDLITNDKVMSPGAEKNRPAVQKFLKLTGHEKDSAMLTNRFLNWIGWATRSVAAACTDTGRTLDECYGDGFDASLFNLTADGLAAPSEQNSWPYQFCTEWGYFQTGSGTPPNQMPIVSRKVSLPFTMGICKRLFNINTPPDVERVNRYGAFNIQYDRLAFVDGEADPWREAGVQAAAAPKRQSTPQRPVHLIPGAIHHWDENGLLPNEEKPGLPPKEIKDIQNMEKQWVMTWLKDFKPSE